MNSVKTALVYLVSFQMIYGPVYAQRYDLSDAPSFETTVQVNGRIQDNSPLTLNQLMSFMNGFARDIHQSINRAVRLESLELYGREDNTLPPSSATEEEGSLYDRLSQMDFNGESVWSWYEREQWPRESEAQWQEIIENYDFVEIGPPMPLHPDFSDSNMEELYREASYYLGEVGLRSNDPSLSAIDKEYLKNYYTANVFSPLRFFTAMRCSKHPSDQWCHFDNLTPENSPEYYKIMFEQFNTSTPSNSEWDFHFLLAPYQALLQYEAQRLLGETTRYVEDERNSEEDRREVLALYMSNVALPMSRFLLRAEDAPNIAESNREYDPRKILAASGQRGAEALAKALLPRPPRNLFRSSEALPVAESLGTTYFTLQDETYHQMDVVFSDGLASIARAIESFGQTLKGNRVYEGDNALLQMMAQAGLQMDGPLEPPSTAPDLLEDIFPAIGENPYQNHLLREIEVPPEENEEEDYSSNESVIIASFDKRIGEGNSPTPLDPNDPILTRFHTQALSIKNGLLPYLEDQTIPAERRRGLLFAYFDDVLLAMRSLVTVKRAYVPGESGGEHFYNDLLLEFPTTLLNGQNQMNELFNSLGLEVVQEGQRSRVVFGASAIELLDVPQLLNALYPPTHHYIQALKYTALSKMLHRLYTYNTIIKENDGPIEVPRACQSYLHVPLEGNFSYPSYSDQAMNMEYTVESMLLSHYPIYLYNHGKQEGFPSHDGSNFTFHTSSNPMEVPAELTDFEEYSSALASIELENNRLPPELEPDIDDTHHFNQVFNKKANEAASVFAHALPGAAVINGIVSKLLGWTGLVEPSPPQLYHGGEFFRKMVQFHSEDHPFYVFQVKNPTEDSYCINLKHPRFREELPSAHNIEESLEQLLQPLDIPPYLSESITEGEDCYDAFKAQDHNLTTFVAELMDQKGVFSYTDVISKSLEQTLRSQEVKLDMPSLYSSHVWRRWGLNALAAFARENKDYSRESSMDEAVARACRPPLLLMPNSDPLDPLSEDFSAERIIENHYRDSDSFCQGLVDGSTDARGVMARVAEFLEQFVDEDEFSYPPRLNENLIKPHYPFLRKLWRALRDHSTVFLVAHTNEYDYLTMQMDQGRSATPWAGLRLSYLLAMEKLENEKREVMTPLTGRKARQASFQINRLIQKIQQASTLLGIHRPLTNLYANGILTRTEKQEMWRDIYYETQQQNHHLLTTELEQEKTTYELLTDISHQTLLSRDEVTRFVGNVQFNDFLDETAHEEIESIENDATDPYTLFIRELYGLKGDLEAQKALISETQGNKFSAARAADELLRLDHHFKTPLLKAVIKKSAPAMGQSIVETMEWLCNLDPWEHEQRRAIFYGTGRIHQEFQEQYPQLQEGEEGIRDIMGDINSMSPADWNMIGFGISGGVGAGVTGMGISKAGGLCALLTAGKCLLAIAALTAIGAVGVGSLSWVASKEYQIKKEADHLVERLRSLLELDFATTDGPDEISRTWIPFAIEIAGLFSLAGIAATILRTTPQSLFAASSHIAQHGLSNSRDLEMGLKTFMSRYEVQKARYSLGSSAVTERLGLQSIESIEGILEGRMKQLEELVSLRRMGKINEGTFMARLESMNLKGIFNDLYGDITVRETPRDIKDLFVTRLARYFGNPSRMHGVIKSYTGERLEKAFWRIKGDYSTDSRLLRTWGIKNVVSLWRKRESVQHLAHFGDEMRRLENDLLQLSQTGGDFRHFLEENTGRLIDLFYFLPIRRRELPFLFFFQGFSHLRLPYHRGRPLISGPLGDGFILEHYARSAARLLYESTKREARERLGMPPQVSVEAKDKVLRAFSRAYEEALDKTTGEARERLQGQYEVFQDFVSTQVLNSRREFLDRLVRPPGPPPGRGGKLGLNTSPLEINKNTVKELLFNPGGILDDSTRIDHQALAHSELLWKSIDLDKIIEGKEMGKLIHHISRILSDYDNPQEFGRFLEAFRILMRHEEPAFVDFI